MTTNYTLIAQNNQGATDEMGNTSISNLKKRFFAKWDDPENFRVEITDNSNGSLIAIKPMGRKSFLSTK